MSGGSPHLGLGRGARKEKKGRAPRTWALGRFAEQERKGRTRGFPSEGSQVCSGCSPCLDENTEKHRPLVGHGGLLATKGRSCISQEGLWAQRPLLLVQ